MSETPINHAEILGVPEDAVCACGAILMRGISIQEGRCQACRNLDIRKVPGYGR